MLPRAARKRRSSWRRKRHTMQARTILGWSYYAGISNDYGAQNAELAYKRYEEAMARIWNMERDRILEENRRLYRK